MLNILVVIWYFVKTGNPNGDNLTNWEKGYESKLTMHFKNGICKMQKVNKGLLWKNMLTKKLVGE